MVYTSASPITIDDLTLNAVDADAVTWRVTGLDGWGPGGTTLQAVQKPRQRGAWAGDAYGTAVSMTLRLLITAPTPAALSAALDHLSTAVSRNPKLMTVSESGRIRWCMVRREFAPQIAKLTNRIAQVAVQIVNLDGRRFGTPLVGSTPLPAASGGLTVPFTVPFSIAAAVATGQVSLTNQGNESGPVVQRIDGPCAGPVITHVSSGTSLVFSSALILAAGEFMIIDHEKRRALANGVESRSAYITSRGWSAFDPGNNTWGFSAAGYDPDSLLTVTATPAWD